jgi:hypothetical protein
MIKLILVTTLRRNGRSYPTKSAISDKIRKERDKKGEQGGSKRNISELSTKQLTTALISSLQKVSASDDSSERTAETPKQSNQAGNVFGGREGVKRQKNSEGLAAMSTSTCVAAYHTSARRLETTSMKTIASITNVTTNTARNELDSHADTCALGSNFIILHYTGRVCDVAPYNSQAYEPQRNIPIVTAATAYTNKETGEVSIIVINEALWFGENLNNPFNSTPMAITTDDLTIPLLAQGTNIYFETTAPYQHELDKYPHIHFTLDTEWDPHSVCLVAALRTAEAEMDIGDGVEPEPGLLQISSVFSAKRMAELLPQERNIKAVDVEPRKTFRSNERHSMISSEQLSERWAIGLNQAKQTIRVTTQRGMRSAILPLSCRYRTDRMYHQKKLRGPKFYTDTLFGRCKSLSKN